MKIVAEVLFDLRGICKGGFENQAEAPIV